MPPLSEIAAVALGGAIGAVSRFLIQNCALAPFAKHIHTLGVNLTGCFLIGVVWALLTQFGAPQWVQRFLIAGLLGGYTTFSAFALDTMQLAEGGHAAAAALYVTASMLGGIFICFIAAYLVRAMLS